MTMKKNLDGKQNRVSGVLSEPPDAAPGEEPARPDNTEQARLSENSPAEPSSPGITALREEKMICTKDIWL